MSIRFYTLLFIISIGILAATAQFQTHPGYMDADYYYLIGSNLADGDGFISNTIWNYLDQPEGLPHPSNAYWMPLASMLSWIGIKLLPSLEPFEAVQWVFILTASFISPLTAKLSFAIWKREDAAKLAGWLALFPGFYAVFLTTSDTFGIYMVLGASYFLLIGEMRNRRRAIGWIWVGVVSGLMHLARAEGLLWMVGAVVYILSRAAIQEKGEAVERNGISVIVQNAQPLIPLAAGYLIVMGPWLWRNLNEFGVLLNPSGLKPLWMKEYNDLFAYPAGEVNFSAWWQTGFASIIYDRIEALWVNIQSMIAVQGVIFLAPLMAAGLWKYRRVDIVRFATFLWGVVLIIMTIVFPYSGARGGFFHAGAGLQPLIWGLAGVGFFEFIDWGKRERGWNTRQATAVFRIGALGMVVAITGGLVIQKLGGGENGIDGWNVYAQRYANIELMIQEEDPTQKEVVLVINPPGYNLVSGRPAIAIPSGDDTALNAAAADFGARFLIVEYDHPPSLGAYYDNKDDRNGWVYLRTIDETNIYMRIATEVE